MDRINNITREKSTTAVWNVPENPSQDAKRREAHKSIEKAWGIGCYVLTFNIHNINLNKLKDVFKRSGKLECPLNFTCHKKLLFITSAVLRTWRY